ncbi:Mobile element protein [Escherichia coli O5:K4(L):H4 str. ATCC 23502]|nr:Mobile element protein [Escherichia coli O5:K4(L):H4 str. ATCC 23502]
MPLLDKLREQYGVGPVCSEQHIAPSTYYHCQQQRHHPDKRSAVVNATMFDRYLPFSCPLRYFRY